jgi:M6 family metalloprotease-like protein
MRYKNRGAALLAFALVLSLIPFSANSNSHGAGPQGPPCGIYKVKKNEVIAGVNFPKGSYQINAFGISCSKVLGKKGLFAKFLKLKDKDPLPKPWKYLADAVGAPKFSSGPGVGFRVQLISQSTPTPTPTPTPSTLSVTDPVESCKIQDASNLDIGVYGFDAYGGFVNKERTIPSTGTVTWYLVPIDFTDLRGEANWRSRVDQQMQLLTEYYDYVSYGKLNIKWKIYDEWITMPGDQEKFQIKRSGDYVTTEIFWREAISLADSKIDFTGVQVVNFLLPKNQTAIPESAQGFPWTGDINKYNSSETKLAAFTILGGYFENPWTHYWTYWAHEYGHVIGIPHLGGSREPYSFQPYDLMGNQDVAREISGWSRFAVTKWIEDDWVYCKSKSNIESELFYLSPLNSTSNSIKLAVIPLDKSQTLILESRRINELPSFASNYATPYIKGAYPLFDQYRVRNGVFAYIYDSSLGGNEEYLRLATKGGNPILAAGDGFSIEGITVKVLEVGNRDKVLISKSN